MRHMLTACYTRPLAAYLIIALLVLTTLAGPAEAMHLPASPEMPQATPGANRAMDIANVQKVLETKELQQRLLDYGLTPEETAARIDSLSDEQLHQLASNLDSVQAGGDTLGFLIGLAILALLVILIVFLLQGKIELKSK